MQTVQSKMLLEACSCAQTVHDAEHWNSIRLGMAGMPVASPAQDVLVCQHLPTPSLQTSSNSRSLSFSTGHFLTDAHASLYIAFLSWARSNFSARASEIEASTLEINSSVLSPGDVLMARGCAAQLPWLWLATKTGSGYHAILNQG